MSAYVCGNVCADVYARTDMPTYMRTCAYPFGGVPVCVCVSLCMCPSVPRVCARVCACGCVRACVGLHMGLCVHVGAHACAYAGSRSCAYMRLYMHV